MTARTATFFAIYFRLRCPSGRTVRKYLARDGGFTEKLTRRWLTPSKPDATHRAARCTELDGEEWEVAEVRLTQDAEGRWNPA